jgi:hypothetical protein
MTSLLENLNHQTFSELLHTTFRVLLPDTPPLALELMEVTERNSSPQAETFSLIFRGPLAPLIGQQIHILDHDTLGRLDLFLVPIGPDNGGMCYQVVFNRLRKEPK